MDETWTLILLSLAMLVGCYLAGSIPLAFSLSEEKLRLVTVMGAGLLVGTALAVIIPEGVHTMYSSQLHQVHSEVSKSLPNPAEETLDAKEAEHGHAHPGTDLHTLIGVALVLGFTFMLLVDQIGGRMHSRPTVVADSENGSPVIQNRNKMTATLGLVVHAAADGVALGAAASTSQTHVEMIVFIAIMLHKAPAAFGLVSFLLHEGFERNRIRKHLAVFSLAAPLLAIITYFGLSQTSKESLSNVQATGIAMLFSAGTFLYVATVHVLPELLTMGPASSAPSSSSQEPVQVATERDSFTKLELFLLVTGAMLPLLFSVGHHH